MGLTDYSANKYLDHLFQRSADIDFGTAVYAALCNNAATPSDDGNLSNFSEPPAAHGYARVLVGYYGQSATYKFNAASVGNAVNGDAIHFPIVADGSGTGNWGNCTHLALFDDLTEGNALFYDTLNTPITPVEGNVPIIAAGGFTASLN